MKAASFQLTFKDLADEEARAILHTQSVSLEFLPCQFHNNIDSCAKEVYFDPIIRPT
jgi:hypothetical protein